MTWVNMLTWWQWSLLALVPPAIVLLYFLKLKREPLEVPSTYLWSKSIEDLHVNSIWQRLRKNLLLLLQLLAVALVMLSVLRLGWQGSQLTGERFIFLVDNSASMASKDVEPSRLAEAKRRVGELLDQMKSGDQAMIISFCDTARVEQLFTDNRRELRRRLEAIQQTNRGTALGEALRLAAGLANPGRAAFEISDTRVAEGMPATLYIFSDGKFPDVSGFRPGSAHAGLCADWNAGLRESGRHGLQHEASRREAGEAASVRTPGKLRPARRYGRGRAVSRRLVGRCQPRRGQIKRLGRRGL